MSQKTQDTAVAMIAPIISSIGAEKVSVGVEPSGVLTIDIRKEGWKLERLVLSTAALDSLRCDPDRAIKLAYLKREIEQTSSRRSAWYYPRLLRYASSDTVRPPHQDGPGVGEAFQSPPGVVHRSRGRRDACTTPASV